jgi:hypothetical protein
MLQLNHFHFFYSTQQWCPREKALRNLVSVSFGSQPVDSRHRVLHYEFLHDALHTRTEWKIKLYTFPNNLPAVLQYLIMKFGLRSNIFFFVQEVPVSTLGWKTDFPHSCFRWYFSVLFLFRF